MIMDESGRKILIGILVVIVAGVGAYFLSLDNAIPGSVDTRAQNVADSTSGRPMGDGAISPEASAVSRAMIGTWRGSDDPKFTREFREDGIIVDRHEGDATATKNGIWGVFTADMAPAGAASGLSSGVVYVQMTIDDASVYFTVYAADTLKLMYLDGGKQAVFARVP